jgi:histidine ammonia-lyase
MKIRKIGMDACMTAMALGAVGSLVAGAVPARAAVVAPQAYQPIAYTSTNTITLTGAHLTIEQVIDVARHGAKVQTTAEAKRRSADAYGLLLEAAAEGIQIYRFNRGAGSQREVVIFSGDPMSPANKALIEQRQLNAFKRGARSGYGEEVSEEQLVRAMMVIRANTLTYASASPQLSRMLLDLLNTGVTPVILSGGTLGEGDLAQITNIEGTMVGVGDAYYHGVRMSAAQALAKAGLKPLAPFGADDDAFDVTDSYSAAESLLLVDEAQRALEWSEMAYAMDLNGLNSSITPMSLPPQIDRPFKWLNWESGRMLDMIRGSYLFQDDPKRIIQDPESMRASPHRAAAAWQAWAALRAAVLTQINASEQNPVVRAGSPGDSWELSTPHFMRYHIKGGAYSNGKSGYVLSNANWDPYPLADTVEAFTNALVNLDVNIDQRIYRFTSTFFTVAAPSDVLSREQSVNAAPGGGGFIASSLWQQIQPLAVPLAPAGDAIVQNVEDLQGQTHLKARRGRQAVDLTLHLLAQDVLNGAYWMDVRKIQDPSRSFGAAPTAAWTAVRKAIPWQMAPNDRPQEPAGQIVYRFMTQTPVSTFYQGIPVPADDNPQTPWLKAAK